MSNVSSGTGLEWARASMRAPPQVPEVELPMGHDSYEGRAEIGAGPHVGALTVAVGGAPCGARSA